jgi:hypothetical protein
MTAIDGHTTATLSVDLALSYLTSFHLLLP